VFPYLISSRVTQYFLLFFILFRQQTLLRSIQISHKNVASYLHTIYLFLTKNFYRYYSVNVLSSLGTRQPAFDFCRNYGSFARPVPSHQSTRRTFRVTVGSASIAAIQIFHESGSTPFCAMPGS